MMRMIEQGEANCVIVKDLSRLGREYIETGRYMPVSYTHLMIDFQNVSFSYGEESSGGGIRNVNLTINTCLLYTSDR